MVEGEKDFMEGRGVVGEGDFAVVVGRCGEDGFGEASVEHGVEDGGGIG